MSHVWRSLPDCFPSFVSRYVIHFLLQFFHLFPCSLIFLSPTHSSSRHAPSPVPKSLLHVGSNFTSPKFLIQYNNPSNEYLQITRSASNPYQQLHHIRAHTDRNVVIILFVVSLTFLFLLTHAIACFIFYGLVCTSRTHCHAYHNNFHRLTLFPFRSLNPFVRPHFDHTDSTRSRSPLRYVR